jgi:hypothetical protein
MRLKLKPSTGSASNSQKAIDGEHRYMADIAKARRESKKRICASRGSLEGT